MPDAIKTFYDDLRSHLPGLWQAVQCFLWTVFGGYDAQGDIAALIAGAALSPLPVLADAREDVVNGMTRCAGLADDRQWLECYYGAAQPMRAWLGLPPAPQSQLRLLQQAFQPSALRPAVLPATVTRAAVRTGPPPKPKRSGIFDVFGGRTWSTTRRSSPIR